MAINSQSMIGLQVGGHDACVFCHAIVCCMEQVNIIKKKDCFDMKMNACILELYMHQVEAVDLTNYLRV